MRPVAQDQYITATEVTVVIIVQARPKN